MVYASHLRDNIYLLRKEQPPTPPSATPPPKAIRKPPIPREKCGRKAKTPPPNQGLKGGQPHSPYAYVKVCVSVCVCVCVYVAPPMTRRVRILLFCVWVCVGIMDHHPPATFVSVTSQTCVQFFVVALL